MKKVTLILTALALVLGITQCKKQESAHIGEKQHIVLTANNGNDGSKVAVESVATKLNLTWEGNETITVSGGATGTLYYFSGDESSATFKGDIEIGSGELIEFHVGSLPVNYEGQAGTDVGLKRLIHLKGTSPYEEDGEYSALMELQFAVLKLDVSALGTTGELTIATGDTQIASVENVSSSAGKEVFVAVPANGSKTEYTFKIGEKTATKTWPALNPNTFYMMDAAGHAIVVNPELLPGKFSISADKYVQFSSGNLQATYNGSGYTFGFAANQYDYIGNAAGNTTIDSQADNAVVDLFGWSTAATNYGIDASQEVTTYSGEFKDWGTAIEGTWSTLTKDEWQYLFNFGINSNATRNGLYAYGVTVVGKPNCVVLYPDGFAGTKVNNGDTSSYDTEDEWSAAQEAGVVCLPAAGYRVATVKEAAVTGSYWSSSKDDGSTAFRTRFDDDEVNPADVSRNRYGGFSVRLVQKSPKPAPEVEFIDLGLPSGTLWANMNVGASKPEESGIYFAWGDVVGQIAGTTGTGAFSTDFKWNNTPFNNGSSEFNGAYFNSVKGTVCPGGILAPEYDAVLINWGETCRMPTKVEFEELVDNTNREWKDNYNGTGVSGYIFKKITDESKFIFLPAAGHGYLKELKESGAFGNYWSSSLSAEDAKDGSRFRFSKAVSPVTDRSYRCNGHTIRAVK